MVVRISDKTQNYSKVTKLLVKPSFFFFFSEADSSEPFFLENSVEDIAKTKLLKRFGFSSSVLKGLIELFPLARGGLKFCRQAFMRGDIHLKSFKYIERYGHILFGPLLQAFLGR